MALLKDFKAGTKFNWSKNPQNNETEDRYIRIISVLRMRVYWITVSESRVNIQ